MVLVSLVEYQKNYSTEKLTVKLYIKRELCEILGKTELYKKRYIRTYLRGRRYISNWITPYSLDVNHIKSREKK